MGLLEYGQETKFVGSRMPFVLDIRYADGSGLIGGKGGKVGNDTDRHCAFKLVNKRSRKSDKHFG